MANEYKLKVVGQFEDDMSKGLDTANKSLGNLGDGLDALKGKASGFGDFLKANLVSSAITSALSAIRDGIKATTDALVDMGKTAYAEGAKLEQSLGGVDTMFKDAAVQVQINASEAWKSGIGANDYMEQVTSFSAALIQSLAGDTFAAAQVADMAIMDMADNANKFGTDISSIQNAYQGFAKQNYTMLDNLKLGYGGTKEEMERMLADAEKLTGVHYDISNLADVYNAIHAIQTELGVAGVSAEEARTTMEGSAKKLQASWKNLLGNITLGGDITDELSAVKESVEDWTSNLVPAVENILDALPTIADGVVEIADDMMAKFGTELVSRAGPLAEAGGKIIGTVLSGLARALPQILSIGGQIVSQVGSALMDNAPEILSSIEGMLSGVPERLAEHADVLLEWGLLAWEKLTDWLQNIEWDTVVDSMVNGIDGAGGLLEGFNKWLDDVTFDNIVEDLGLDKLFSEENTAVLVRSLGDLFVALVNTGGKLATTFASVGLDIAIAIMDGIKDNSDTIGQDLSTAIEDLTTTVGNWVADHIDDILGLASDSIITFFFDLAPQAVYGFARGLAQINWGEFVGNIGQGIAQSVENGFDTITDTVFSMGAEVFGMDEETKKYLDDYGWGNAAKISGLTALGRAGAWLGGFEFDEESAYQWAEMADGAVSKFFGGDNRENIANLFGHLWANGEDLADNLKNKLTDQGVLITDEFYLVMMSRIQAKSEELSTATKEEADAIILDVYDRTIADFQSRNPANAVADEITESIPELESAVDDAGNSITTSFQDILDMDWQGLGEDIVSGISAGMDDDSDIITKMTNMAVNAFNTVKDFFGIASPSTLMRDEIGKFIPEGIAVGIDENTGSIISALDNVKNVVLDESGMIISNTSASAYQGGGDNTRTLNVGGVTNNIYGAQGQNEENIADYVVGILINRLRSEGAVFA